MRQWYRFFQTKYRGLVVQHTSARAPQAEIACELVERWGMVAAVPDGEDSAGRQRLRCMTPQELVERAVSTAELLVEAIDQRGWYIDVPADASAENGD